MGAGCDPQGHQVQQCVDRRRDERPPRGLRASQAVQPRNGGVAHDQCRRDGRVHRTRIGPNREGVGPVRRVRVWGSTAGNGEWARPIGDGDFILVDWVTECLQMGGGSVLDAADARLERRYVAEEMEMVLGLGLICSHQRQESRPTMRQVVRYLNCEDQLPSRPAWVHR
ncbi:unnamed protein product [Linum tenue]|uniref:Uncharacterized protein n=1 Tax=Linum tenue TaxID=586396 RepID=A0AAV0KKV3_9ROSI|nr:unnamed protein product [Linum tenue]